jgi:hypothetical protein
MERSLGKDVGVQGSSTSEGYKRHCNSCPAGSTGDIAWKALRVYTAVECRLTQSRELMLEQEAKHLGGQTLEKGTVRMRQQSEKDVDSAKPKLLVLPCHAT